MGEKVPKETELETHTASLLVRLAVLAKEAPLTAVCPSSVFQSPSPGSSSPLGAESSSIALHPSDPTEASTNKEVGHHLYSRCLFCFTPIMLYCFHLHLPWRDIFLLLCCVKIVNGNHDWSVRFGGTGHGCLVVTEYENSTCILGVQCLLQLVTELLYHRTLNLRTVYQHLFLKNVLWWRNEALLYCHGYSLSLRCPQSPRNMVSRTGELNFSS